MRNENKASVILTNRMSANSLIQIIVNKQSKRSTKQTV